MMAHRASSLKNGSVHESHLPDEPSGNHRRRYSGIYRNPDRVHDAAVIRRQQQHGHATLIYQRAMSVSDWTGASVIALIMIVVTLVVIKGFNALAARWTAEVKIMRKIKC